ncbi:hypothetical protein J416_01229 [Gracilibacillus halophilus YIM-C55.5]|uniref:YfhD family protein n=1 Tax=Gracilibacillus halophilus YIM-C55.5 TaxID=1308866 RepID=N4WGC5_9BACI|nr:YfhD family protein [Gracilibacillus halophilus]ENH98319.1 hypothetical protein J416_01229 [Gracilibacillus halophilus YIM-C55.5]
MGRDEHTKPKGKKPLAQTPKNQIAHAFDTEFSEELADHDDQEAMARSEQAEKRMQERSRKNR